LGLFPHAKIV